MPAQYYLDTNAIHRLRTTWLAVDFDRRASKADLVLALGHVVYELARGFLSPGNADTIQSTFGYLAEIDQVDYLPPVDAVIAGEFDKARLGVPIIVILDPLNRVSMKHEIAMLRTRARRSSNGLYLETRSKRP